MEEVEIQNGVHALLIDSNWKAVILNSSEAVGDVCIPRFVEYKNVQYIITTIGENAFKGAKRLTKISFAHDSDVTTIENYAFKDSSITQLSLPPKLEFLHENWCIGINNLNKIRIPHNRHHKFKLIDEKFLTGSSLLTSKFFCNYITGNYITGNFLLGKDGIINNCNELFFAHRDITEATIPQNIRVINSYAFQNCKKLECLTFSNEGIEEIRRESFAGCTKLSNVITFPKTLQRISYGAFRNDENLRILNFYSDTIIFEPYCFQGCTNLKEINTRASNIYIKQFSFDESVELHVNRDAIIDGIDVFKGKIVYKDSSPTLKSCVYSKSEPLIKKMILRGASDTRALDHSSEKKDRYIKCLQDLLSSKSIDFPSYTTFEHDYNFEKFKPLFEKPVEKESSDTINESKEESKSEENKEESKTDNTDAEKESSTDLSDDKINIKSDSDNFKKEIYKQIVKISQTEIYDIWMVVDTRTNYNLSKIILKPSEFSTANNIPQKTCQEFEKFFEINHPCICKECSMDGHDSLFYSTNLDNMIQNSVPTYSFYFEIVSQHLKSILNDNLKIDNTKKALIAIEILCGMIYLIKIGIDHENLTIDNILVNENFEAKIMLLSIFDRGEPKNDFDNKVENFDCEMSYSYSFGLILYELFVDSRFGEQSLKKLNEITPSNSVSQFCIDLIKKCISSDLSIRPKLNILLLVIIQEEYKFAEGVDSDCVNNRYLEITSFEEKNPPRPINNL